MIDQHLPEGDILTGALLQIKNSGSDAINYSFNEVLTIENVLSAQPGQSILQFQNQSFCKTGKSISKESRIKKSSRGFTLIELLVVFAIISILAAILFPVFTRARENARRASCQSNLKQIGLSIFQYTQDYDEKFPLYNYNTDMRGWVERIQPYIKSLQILQCPSETTNGSSSFPSGVITDYGYNLWTGYDDSTANNITAKFLNIAAYTNPSLTVMVMDHTTNNGSRWVTGVVSGGSYSNCAGITPCSPGLAQFTTVTGDTASVRRHLDGQNFVFADGHVKWYKAATDTQSAAVYNVGTFATGTAIVSGNNPTFNPAP